MAAKKFKMAPAELRNSPIYTLKLKFEAVVLIDWMYLAYNEEGGIQIEVLIPK